MAHRLSSPPGQPPHPVPHGQEPLGNRKPRLQRCQEPLRLGAPLPPPGPQPAGGRVADLFGPHYRTALPPALPPSRYPPPAHRHRPAPALAIELGNAAAGGRGFQLRLPLLPALPSPFPLAASA